MGSPESWLPPTEASEASSGSQSRARGPSQPAYAACLPQGGLVPPDVVGAPQLSRPHWLSDAHLPAATPLVTVQLPCAQASPDPILVRLLTSPYILPLSKRPLGVHYVAGSPPWAVASWRNSLGGGGNPNSWDRVWAPIPDAPLLSLVTLIKLFNLCWLAFSSIQEAGYFLPRR